MPNQERTLGEFMSPVPASATPTVSPQTLVCSVPVTADAIGAQTISDVFIDGNTDAPGESIDIGSAQPNICE